MSSPNAQIEIQNLFAVQIYIRHMSNLKLVRTVALRAI